MDKLHERDAEPESGPRKRAKPEPPTKATNTYTLPASISYKQVASKFPELQEHLIQETNSNDHYTLDFQDPLAVRTLNRALLHVYFDLQIHLPRTNLCPTVANRLSYVEWINSAILCDFYPSTNRVVRGLDIGCGASCIYPLLGSRVLQGCSFVGTDVRADSISIARDNVRANGLEPRIQLFLNKRINTTLPFDDHDDADNAGFFSQLPVDADGSVFTFSMCNPPFYSDHVERERLRGFKEHGPGLNTCGEDEELYTLGGEQGFLGRMVDESIRWGPYVKWYTTMCGRKSTLAFLKTRIRETPSVKHIRESRLVHGNTTRWVIAWSFVEQTRFCLDRVPLAVDENREWFGRVMRELRVEVRDVAGEYFVCVAREKTWTRQWRRQQKKLGKTESPVDAAVILQFTAVPRDTGQQFSQLDLYLEPGSPSNLLMSLYNHLIRRVPSSSSLFHTANDPFGMNAKGAVERGDNPLN